MRLRDIERFKLECQTDTLQILIRGIELSSFDPGIIIYIETGLFCDLGLGKFSLNPGFLQPLTKLY